MSVFGHAQLQSFFSTGIQNGHLGHAYCLVGEEQIGKKFFATQIAGQLLHTSSPETHPDYICITQEINEKTGKTKKSLDVEQIKRVREFFSRFAAMGGYRIAVIDQAELMNEHASNALLKTLEELPAQSLIFFITSDEQAIAKTILSRCQICYVTPLSLHDMTAFAASITGEVSADMIRYAHGRPGLLHTWVTEPEVYAQYQQEVARFFSFVQKPLYKKIDLVEELFGTKEDHIAARGVLEKILDIWALLVRDWYMHSSGNTQFALYQQSPSTTLNRENMLLLLHTIAQAQQRLRQNVHPRLIVEDILLAIP